MNETQAAKLAGILGASYPGRTISKANLAAWSAQFIKLDVDIGTEVAGKLVSRMSEPPAVSQLLDCIREVTGVTQSPVVEIDDGQEQITFAEFLRRNPDMRQKVDDMYARTAARKGGVGSALRHLENQEREMQL